MSLWDLGSLFFRQGLAVGFAEVLRQLQFVLLGCVILTSTAWLTPDDILSQIFVVFSFIMEHFGHFYSTFLQRYESTCGNLLIISVKFNFYRNLSLCGGKRRSFPRYTLTNKSRSEFKLTERLVFGPKFSWRILIRRRDKIVLEFEVVVIVVFVWETGDHLRSYYILFFQMFTRVRPFSQFFSKISWYGREMSKNLQIIVCSYESVVQLLNKRHFRKPNSSLSAGKKLNSNFNLHVLR